MTVTWSHCKAVFSIVLDRRRPKSPKTRHGGGWVLELGIAPPSGKPSRETRRQTTLIRALVDREQAASPPSLERGRAARAQGEDPNPRQDPGNHARWPHRRTSSGAPAPCGWPGLYRYHARVPARGVFFCKHALWFHRAAHDPWFRGRDRTAHDR